MDRDEDVVQAFDTLSEVEARDAEPTSGGKRDHRDKVIEIVEALAIRDAFTTPEGRPFLSIELDGRVQCFYVKSREFKLVVQHAYYNKTGQPAREPVDRAIELLEARVRFEGDVREVGVRVASHADKVYLDLADDAGNVVEISASGWRVVQETPVHFWRPKSLQSLPLPERGGSTSALDKFLNVASDDDPVLVEAWLLAALRGMGPFPVLILTGEQGSSKSTTSRLLRRLVDPSTAELRNFPSGEHDLFIAARNSHVLVYDNITEIGGPMSDALCRMATGGSFATRRLYSDEDELVIEAKRPTILNGIGNLAGRPDLLDRALVLHLEAIPPENRRSEEELWKAFDAVRPALLGALLDGVSRGLKNWAKIKPKGLPRMADFARWGIACDKGGAKGTFIRAYDRNLEAVLDDVVAQDPVGEAVMRLVADKECWSGTATELDVAIRALNGGRMARDWPGSPNALSNRLKRIVPALRAKGIDVQFGRRGRAGTRILEITCGPSGSKK